MKRGCRLQLLWEQPCPFYWVALDLRDGRGAREWCLGWFVSAALLGGYGEGAKSGRIGPAAATTFRCWLLATPVILVSVIVFFGSDKCAFSWDWE